VFELMLLFAVRFSAMNVIRLLLARDAIAGRAAIVIGESREIGRLSAATFLQSFGLKETGRVVLDAAGGTESDVEQRRGVLLEAMAFARQTKADEFFIAASWNQVDLLAEITDVLRNSPLPVRLLPDQIIRSILDRRAAASAVQMLVVEIQRAPMGRFDRAIKRLFDIAVASIALLVTSPLFMIAAVAIKVDSPGPIIFRQRRKGFDEHQFFIFKFRTMRVLEDDREIVQAKRDDFRVTRVGRWLRRTSVDELPQLFNVIKGDMSLIGPRPHAVAHDDQYKKLLATYCWRHHVKPGITGWAQVNGLRGETTRLEQMQHRIEYDLWYINNRSFGLDTKILLRTCLEVLRHEAY
jgi:undecaprenyl-phosphate galactose phosphotransferase/putative colanic acid biosynthesis UDP-glucose lipid carrier transferase